MKTLTSLFRPVTLLAALPAVLAFSACSKDDPDPVVIPDQGKIMAVHAAVSASAKVKVLADAQELAQLDYSTNNAYATVDAGARSIKINDASSNTTSVTKSLTVEKDKNYSVFAYSPSTSLGSVDVLSVTDDLTAPSAGKAKIRVVHLGVSAPSPLSLSQSAAIGTVDIVPNTVFGAASSFVEITPGNYNLLISTGTGATATTEIMVGDGSGSGTGLKAYDAGKIYTVLIEGIKSTTVAQNLRLKAVVFGNN